MCGGAGRALQLAWGWPGVGAVGSLDGPGLLGFWGLGDWQLGRVGKFVYIYIYIYFFFSDFSGVRVLWFPNWGLGFLGPQKKVAGTMFCSFISCWFSHKP